jgi:hypothetical protein
LSSNQVWGQQRKAKEFISLEVDSTPEASSCPTTAALLSALRNESALRTWQAAPPKQSSHVHIRFSKIGTAFHVEIELSGSRSGQRVFTDHSTTCNPIAEATIVALSVLFENTSPELSPDKTVKTAPLPKKPKPQPVTATKPPSEPRHSLRASFGPSIVWGLFPETAWGPSFDIHWHAHHPALSFGLAGERLVAAKFQIQSGTIKLDLLDLSSYVCWDFWQPSWATTSGCARASFGVLNGRGEGFTTDRSDSGVWLSGGPMLRQEFIIFNRLQLSAEADLVVPWYSRPFGVDGVGTVFRADRLGVKMSFQVGMSIW